MLLPKGNWQDPDSPSLQAEGRFAEARQAFYAALQFDPDFGLAEQAYLDMPVKATSVDDVRAELRSGD